MSSDKINKSFHLSPFAISTLSELSNKFNRSESEVLEYSLYLLRCIRSFDTVYQYSEYSDEDLIESFFEHIS